MNKQARIAALQARISALQTKVARKLHKRQEKILEKYLDSAGSRAVANFDQLPSNVRSELERIKDTETLWSDVERWLGDNNNPHLQSKWAGAKETFEIIVESWSIEATEESFDEGEIGRGQLLDNGRNAGPFKSPDEVIKYFAGKTNASKDKKAWSALDFGRIICVWTGDANGHEMSSGDMARWKKGEIKGYLIRIDAYLKVTKVWTPTPKEISQMFKIRMY